MRTRTLCSAKRGHRGWPTDASRSAIREHGGLKKAATADDPSRIAARCLLKAQGCLWTTLKAAGADHLREIAPRDRKIIEREETVPGCWLCPTAAGTEDPSLYETVAGCFEALGASLNLFAQIEADLPEGNGFLHKMLYLLAESQSAVRSAVRQLGAPQDEDERDAHLLLRERTFRFGVFVDRFMRNDDPANPGNWPGIVESHEGFGNASSSRKPTCQRTAEPDPQVAIPIGTNVGQGRRTRSMQ